MRCDYCGNQVSNQNPFDVWDICKCYCETCGKLLEDEDFEEGLNSLEAELCFECQILEAGY